MNNGLLYLGGLMALVLAALFGVPYFVDWNGYRGVFEEEATKVLGREVRVGGAVNVRFLPTPYVRFEKVRIADPSGRTGEPFVRAESFTMRLAVSPLLRGAFEANDIELNKPVLSLVLDGEGGGNWTSLQLKPAALPFVPQNVALHAVRIADGTVLVHGPSGKPVSRIEAIQGELSADTLQGPFKFKGSAAMSGERRDFKLATLEPGPDGAVRFKASMLGESSQNFYAIDGAITDFATKPKITGELTGKLSLLRPEPASREGSAEKTAANTKIMNPKPGDAKPGDAKNGNEDVTPVFDLKSTFAADAMGARFDALELDLEGAAEAQLVTGTAAAQWGEVSRFDTALQAKWLDLDVLAAPSGQTASLARIGELSQALLAMLGGNGSAAAKIEIEQIKIGGDQAGALKVDAELTGDTIALREIKGGLPGGARFEFAGTIKDQGGEKILEGDGAIRGVNVARVQAWVQKSGGIIDLKADGPFWVAGHISANDSGVKLTSAKAELAGQTMSGDVAISSKERRDVTIRIETAKLDTAAFFPAEAARITTTLKRGLGLSGETPAAKPADAAAEAQSDFAIRIAAGELHHDGRIYRDVDARLTLEGQDLRIPGARFSTQAGVAVNVSGSVNTAGSAPKGTISYDIEAPGHEALQEAANFSGLSQMLPASRLAAMSSARLSGLIRLGKRLPAAADVSFDGIVDGARLTGEAAFDTGFSAWRTAPSRISLSTTSPDAPRLLKALGVPAVSLKGIEPRPAEVTLAISGLLANGAQSYGAIKADGLDATLTGKLRHDAADGYAFKGQATVIARDAREALALAGIPAPAGIVGTKLDGNVEIAAEKGVLTLRTSGLQAGTNSIAGEVRLAPAVAQAGAPGDAPGGAPGASSVTATIEADRVVVSSLLGWLGEREPGASDAPAPVAYSVWPEAPFNFDGLGNINGEVRLKAGVLELAEGLAVRESTARLLLQPGKLTIAELKGRAAGGTFSTSGSLEKVPGGVSLDATLGLEADLAKLSPAAAGQASIQFTGSGRGASPAGVIAALAGKGSIGVKGASQPGPSSGVVADVADSVLTAKLENETEELAEALTQSLDNSRADFASRTIPFTVANGDAKLDAISVEGPLGSARVATIVSLASLAIDSVWQVTANAAPLPPPPEALPDWKPAPKGPLPAVTFVYTGSIGDLAQLQVKVDAKDLQRELQVRQMERKLEELDAIRKRDEDRQRQEVERRKALDAERAAAKAAQQQGSAPVTPQATTTPQAVPMPPVIPQNAAPKDASQAAPQAAPQSVPQSTPQSVPQAAPQAAQSDPAAAPIEPASSPPSAETADSDGSAGAPRLTNAPRPPPQPRPAQRPRRTTSDEVNKAFGGWP